ncbi:Glycosyl transferase, family 8 [Cordyceps fumosorosea ARSEF 2679]|uniref:Glycosyl transferase, family 8 n=1 Tax=Cordyceps fumosorosea (strain ARSEF 2679) TaxID=1081104 RepID=A0A167LHV5_CORFA|nr:Glycosyl transferase, family 8 [Cordyceps fumosorosea ARSEF 2679]OAA53107.1 Glycosyl transferase, family 8 [Cordyceps fumosorosea ARSEF 2679]
MTQSARPKRAAPSDKVWATLITNLSYLAGVLTLDHSLRRVHSAYPLLALYTDALPASALAALAARGIPSRRVDPLAASSPDARDFSSSPDPRFADTFTKLSVFSLVEHDRVVLLDSDMLVLRNMDELMDLPLDDPSLAAAATASPSSSSRVFAASHVCACNPLRKPHYPKSWVRENCAFTRQAADDPDRAQREGADPRGLPVAMMNGGLAVLRPSAALYRQILDKVARDGGDMYFPDQEVLSELWRDRWVALPYVYNALKTMRRPDVHADVWRDDEVKNVHYILSPKPWDEVDEHGNFTGDDETHGWWVAANQRRRAEEKLKGITDGY